MSKRHLHHLLVRLRPFKTWYFAAVFLVSATVAVFALRQNNLTALRLRDKLFEADKNNTNVEGALRELREFTYSHMNSHLSASNGIYPPIQLKYTYDRLVAAEQARVTTSNDDLYSAAQRYCEATHPQGLSGSNRLDCIRQYVDQHGTAPVQPQAIPDSLYKFDFADPVWSPDLAGCAIVISVIALILLLARLTAEWWLKNRIA